jgi:hypothetical protein
MRGAWGFAALLLAACGAPGAPKPPPGHSVGAGGDGDDTAAACYTCTLIDCLNDDSPPDDLTSEGDCADLAEDQECDDYTWEEGC